MSLEGGQLSGQGEKYNSKKIIVVTGEDSGGHGDVLLAECITRLHYEAIICNFSDLALSALERAGEVGDQIDAILLIPRLQRSNRDYINYDEFIKYVRRVDRVVPVGGWVNNNSLIPEDVWDFERQGVILEQIDPTSCFTFDGINNFIKRLEDVKRRNVYTLNLSA